MKPIDFRVDHAYTHALRCVEYRIPREDRMELPAIQLALALRYGLMGAAATHQLLICTDAEEAPQVIAAADAWEEHVRDHLEQRVQSELLSRSHPVDVNVVSSVAEGALREYLATYHRHCSAGACLEDTARSFQQRHVAGITKGWVWYRHRRAKELFRQVAAESVRYASLFYERRMADLDEVPEIALLGE